MERAGKLLAKLKLPAGSITPRDLAVALWAEAVGPRIAARTRALTLISRRLVVEVDDEVWRRQLSTLEGQILQRLAKVAGAGVAEEIEFRLPVRRKPVKTAEPRPSQDEADGIPDFLLRALYRRDRTRRTA